MVSMESVVTHLLVRLVSTLGVADLGHEVVLLVEDVVLHEDMIGQNHDGFKREKQGVP